MLNAVNMGSRIVPANFGPMRGANAHGKYNGPCGDTMEIWLRVMDGKVVQAMFTSDGCQHSILCGSAAAALSLGKSREQLEAITPEDVVAQIDSLPVNHQHCALLAVRTLNQAVKDYWCESQQESGAGSAPAPSEIKE